MQTNKGFFDEIQRLIDQAIVKNASPLKVDAIKISQRQNKTFIFNKNKIDVKKEWKEIEKFLEEVQEEDITKQEQIGSSEENKVKEHNESILKTPQSNTNLSSFENTKMIEPFEQIEKSQFQNFSSVRRILFDLD